MKAKKKKLSKSAFHSAQEEIKQTKALHHPTPSAAFTDLDFLLREELRPVRLQLELLRPELVFRDHDINETLVFFGSARIPEEKVALDKLKRIEHDLRKNGTNKKLQQQYKHAKFILSNSQFLKQAEQLAYLASKDKKTNFVVLSGGGPSFMEAANRGAARAKSRSIALNMLLPEEQIANLHASPELTFQFHYFAIRKMHFLLRAKALAAFPGGFGTLDELFEALTLMQTKKIDKIPLLLFHEAFWRKIVNFEALVEEGTISPEDLDYIQYVETAEQAWEIIRKFYQIK